MSAVFHTPHEQYREHNGRHCTIVATFDHTCDENPDYEDVGVIHHVRFDDGEIITAYPEELR